MIQDSEKPVYSRRSSIDPVMFFKDRKQSIDIFNTDKDLDLAIANTVSAKQLEEYISSTKKINELEDLNFFLTNENEFLSMELKQLNDTLKVSESTERELNHQLSEMSTKLALASIKNENNKIDQLAQRQLEDEKMSNPSVYKSELTDQNRRAQFEIKTLRDKLMEQNSQIQNQNKEIKDLRQEIRRMANINHKLEKQAEFATDPRSKSELLEIIRTKMEEKIYWESYAETLLRLIVVNNPDLLNTALITSYSDLDENELNTTWNNHIHNISQLN